MRLRGRTDGNHTAIVLALRLAGCRVISLAPLGGGVPDLVVARGGWTCLMEIKTEDGAVSEHQAQFLADWPGEAHVVRTAEEALRLVNYWSRRPRLAIP